MKKFIVLNGCVKHGCWFWVLVFEGESEETIWARSLIDIRELAIGKFVWDKYISIRIFKQIVGSSLQGKDFLLGTS